MIQSVAARVLILAAVTLVGCSKGSLGKDTSGAVTLALTLPGGSMVDTVTYQITGNGIAPINGSIDVSAPGTTAATALVSPVAAGTYTVTMTAVGSPALTCSGSAPFTVVANMTAMVTVILQCRAADGLQGAVAIIGRLGQCPYLTSISATSLQQTVGSSLTVAVSAVELDPGDVITYSWTQSTPGIGTLATPNAASTTFTCSAVGTTFLSIAISDGLCGDSRPNAIPIVCTPGSGPSGGGGASGAGGLGGNIVVDPIGGSGGRGGTGGASPSSCIETHPPAALAASCDACLDMNIEPTVDGCCGILLFEGTLRCERASACMRVGNCNFGGDITTCYCGTNQATCDAAGAPNGPCVEQVTAAAAYNVVTGVIDAPTPAQVLARQGDPNYAYGRAANVHAFAGSFCSQECGIGEGSTGTGGGSGTGGSSGAGGVAGTGGPGGRGGIGGTGGIAGRGGAGGAGGIAGFGGMGGGQPLVCPASETFPPLALAATCQVCLATNLDPTMDGCCNLAGVDDIGFTLCQAASQCMRNGGPPVGQCNVDGDTTTCYCGTNQATCDMDGQPNGPCVAEITAAAGRNVVLHATDVATPSAVISRYGNSNYAMAWAANAHAFAAAVCPTECGF